VQIIGLKTAAEANGRNLLLAAEVWDIKSETKLGPMPKDASMFSPMPDGLIAAFRHCSLFTR
jgi:hypothetical protein